MRLFTAEASLYKTSRQYQTAVPVGPVAGGAFPAQLELEPEDADDDCLSGCLEAGGSEEECTDECTGAEEGEEL